MTGMVSVINKFFILLICLLFSATVNAQSSTTRLRSEDVNEIIVQDPQGLYYSVDLYRLFSYVNSLSSDVTYMTRSDIKGVKHPIFQDSGTTYVMSDGSNFFPIGMYSVPLDQLQTVKDAGFNTVQTYEAQPSLLAPYMSQVKSIGLKAIFTICNTNYVCSDSNIRNSAKNYKDDVSLLSWYLKDEPGLAGVTPETLIHMDDIIGIETSTPTSIVLSNPQYYEEYKDSSDIFMIDPYPIKPTREIIEVADWVDLARFATDDSKPVVAVLQAFEGWSWPRLPTQEEVRVMSYLAVIHGAKGLMYYTYHSDGGFSMVDNPVFWASLSEVSLEIRDNAQMFLSLDHGQKAMSSDNRVHVLAKNFNNKRIVIAANSVDQPISVLIDGVEMTFSAYEVKIL